MPAIPRWKERSARSAPRSISYRPWPTWPISTLPSDAPVAYVTQTTLSVDDTRDVIAALQARFIDLQGPDVADICYATQHRQSAVRELCRAVDLLLVVGSHEQLQLQPPARDRASR